jgi:hypothetical protein
MPTPSYYTLTYIGAANNKTAGSHLVTLTTAFTLAPLESLLFFIATDPVDGYTVRGNIVATDDTVYDFTNSTYFPNATTEWGASSGFDNAAGFAFFRISASVTHTSFKSVTLDVNGGTAAPTAKAFSLYKINKPCFTSGTGYEGLGTGTAVDATGDLAQAYNMSTLIWVVSVENTPTLTCTPADTSATALQVSGTTGGGSTSNVAVYPFLYPEWVGGTFAQSFTLNASSDWACVYVNLVVMTKALVTPTVITRYARMGTVIGTKAGSSFAPTVLTATWMVSPVYIQPVFVPVMDYSAIVGSAFNIRTHPTWEDETVNGSLGGHALNELTLNGDPLDYGVGELLVVGYWTQQWELKSEGYNYYAGQQYTLDSSYAAREHNQEWLLDVYIISERIYYATQEWTLNETTFLQGRGNAEWEFDALSGWKYSRANAQWTLYEQNLKSRQANARWALDATGLTLRRVEQLWKLEPTYTIINDHIALCAIRMSQSNKAWYGIRINNTHTAQYSIRVAQAHLVRTSSKLAAQNGALYQCTANITPAVNIGLYRITDVYPVTAYHEVMHAARTGEQNIGFYTTAARTSAIHAATYHIYPHDPTKQQNVAPFAYMVPVKAYNSDQYRIMDTIPVDASNASTYGVRLAAKNSAYYEMSTHLLVAHDDVYSLNAVIRQANGASFAYTGSVKQPHAQPYDLYEYNRPIASNSTIYNLQTGTATPVPGVSATLQYMDGAVSRAIDLAGCSVQCRESDAFWTAELQLDGLDAYRTLARGQEVVVNLGPEQYAMFVDSKSLSRSDFIGQTFSMTCLSPIAKLQNPRYPLYSKTWTSATLASDIAAEIGALAGLTVTWSILDWMVAPHRLSVEDSDPYSALKALADAVGGVIESLHDGNIIVRPRYPVSPMNYPTAVPDEIFTDSADNLSITENYEHRPYYNSFEIGDSEPEAANDRIEFIPDEFDPTVGVLRAYLYPWRPDEVRLISTGPASVVLSGKAAKSRTEEQLVEVADNSGSTSYPIFTLLAVDWHEVDLGAVTFTEGLSDFLTSSTTDTHSMVHLTYTTKYLEYQAVGNLGDISQIALEEI